ncbi:SusD/RagB family nutrient-binding outer membrane lipoprotein [Cellulophaga baltica]|uniref:SusD/RagB family nutrient-binding outer membrane lipoprotein n=1 Tax=Cellulophaga TaxID=104264 RepID=UPI001C06F030|nr:MULTISPECIES: SusD/RagB family nutrient-binding outer membrane lipoprotein [Cellulophaga]MBU2996902.1 SusD/RagB family nutrient-binding outer membrane lipoprotein [Cellulophaga baltica]MDO6768300.1 SusD/RagB family nutrient-binding outer membrane lipoprotein [Cellulophaga sp. 1_MG-2023]
MKKILITALTIITLGSCQSDDVYESLNTDPKNPVEVEASSLFNSATKSLFDQMTSTSVNTNIFRMLGQHWTETTYTDEANYDFTTRSIPGTHWSEMYENVLFDLKSAKEIVDADDELTQEEKDSRNAQIEVLEIYTWAQLVETFGDIPYSQALNDSEYILPEYDDAVTIYSDLISRLNTVIPTISGTGFDSSDPIYSGDATSWTKFGYSLLLRMGLRVIDVSEMTDEATDAINTAISGGVFTSNDDNAEITYESSTPNTNPVWVDLVQSGRSDFVPANTLVDFMNNLNDPRRAYYFDDNLGEDTYLGGIYGATNAYTSYSHIGDPMLDPENPACLIDYAEVSFYLADVAERGISSSSGDAETLYNAGITASFDYWGATNVEDYLANADVAYTTAPGTWKEKIGNQLWIAMYNRGYEAWTSWRVYDSPTFNLPGDEDEKSPVPTRYTYPVDEQNLNEANYNEASNAIGGDTQTTKLFFDVE